MRYIKHHAWLGVWLLVVAFLGVPGTWKNWLVSLTALILLAAAFLEYRKMYLTGREVSKQTDSYQENGHLPVADKQ